jgi:hypothetical protein
VAFNHARAAPTRVQPIEKACQQDCAGAVDVFELR